MAIQLDDDDLVLRTWALAARAAGVRLSQHRDPAAFLAELETLPRETDVFIDARLGDGARGEDIARRAHELGFARIYLATGLPNETFSGMPWIRGFVGKEPPWIRGGKSST